MKTIPYHLEPTDDNPGRESAFASSHRELQALFTPGHIFQLTTEGVPPHSIWGEGLVNQGGVAPNLEDQVVVLVGPYVGMVVEVHGDQGVPEALGKVAGQAPEH